MSDGSVFWVSLPRCWSESNGVVDRHKSLRNFKYIYPGNVDWSGLVSKGVAEALQSKPHSCTFIH
jgi:hypothetical protein